jgi:Clp amino terminal domain, pathogenicity island component
VLERFTMQSRAAVALGVEEAWAAGHAAVGTEHILLGLLHAPETVAGRALSALEVDLAEARLVVRRALGRAEPTEGQIPFTPAAQYALGLALPEAVGRGRGEVEPEDILFALVAHPDTGAAQTLLELGATPEDVRLELERLALALAPAPAPPKPPAWPGPAQPMAEGEPELGWRGRGIALAALGAAVLARSAFGARRAAPLLELEMQLLVYLALALDDDPAASAGPGEAVDFLPVALACDREDMSTAIEALQREQLVVRPETPDDDRVAITPAGTARVAEWLARTVPLFDGWPPEHPGVDDATG